MRVGQVLGHYHVIRTLGRGGMGDVYEASDTRLNRQVALKVLPAKMASNAEWFKRFEREAQAVAALNHPNIVTIHSVEEADDVHFIILELVGGKTLDALIPEGGLTIEQFFEIAIPLTDAIAAAHRRGIAHRDLKPTNVMVDDEGRVKVLDFGIAKLIEEDIPEDEAATQIGSEALTEEGKIVGTVAYMSPEQAEGKAADPRSDIFSLGILLYEMATGDRPFVGETKLSILASIVKDDPQPIYERNMEMPRHLARIVKKALEKNLSRRYQSVVELRNDLIELKEEIDAGEPLITGGALTDPGTMDAYRAAPAPQPSSSKGLWLGVAGIVVAAAALGYAFLGPSREAPAPAGPPMVTQTQLTTSPTIDFGGTISPDGEWFAFTRRPDDGGHEIHLQSVGSRSSMVTAPSGASPAFSADGRQVAFSAPPVLTSNTAIGGGIWIMGRTGDDARQLTSAGYNPAWSPDAKEIVYADEFVSSRPYSRLNDSKLHVFNVDTGEGRVLAPPDGVQPHWSPNGHRIAYWAIERGQRDIWTVRPDGTGALRVTNDVPVDFSPVWSPDGNWIYFASTRGGLMAIWRVAIDEESGETLADPQPITSGGLGDPGMLSFSGDGTRLLYTATLTRGSILSADFDPDTLSLAADLSPVVEGQRRLVQPDISPDGSRIAYRTEGAQQDIFVAGTDGENERQVTNDPAKDWAPRWSPDGTRLAFYTNATGDYEVWLANPDGTGRVQLTESPNEAPQVSVWSPDGSRIMTFLSGGDKDTYVIDANAGTVQVLESLPPLPRVQGGNGQFQVSDWHPDGATVVGTVDPIDSGIESTAVWLFNLEDGGLRASGRRKRTALHGRWASGPLSGPGAAGFLRDRCRVP